MPKTTCSVPSCTKYGKVTRGWCAAHYRRWTVHGDVQADKPLAGNHPPICTVDGCDAPSRGRGWCSKHYSRWLTKGRLDVPDLAERLWSHVDKDGPIPVDRPDLGPCWLWMSTIGRGGYGRSGYYGVGKNAPAHRVTYELLIGPIPEGLQIDHLCRVRKCVNPAHLEPVTAWENNRRSESPSAKYLRQTHCIRGHEFTARNTYVPPKRPNRRECRACQRVREHSFRALRNPT